MSDDLWVADPESEQRRRAAWGFTILGLLAVIVVALMVFLIGSSGGDDSPKRNANDIPLGRSTAQNSPSASAPGSTSSTAKSSTPPTSTAPTSSASTAATTTCSSGSSCTLEGDAGKVIDAINKLRTSNGQAAVPGTTTDEAKTCSLNNGGGGCPSSYFWEPVSPQDGSAVVDKILGKGDGRSFLLNPSMKSLQVGWAFVGGQYSCTIVAVT